MTTALTLGRPTGMVAEALRAIVTAARAAAKRRAQRLALAEIMRMDARHIEDLGIVAQDVVEALAAPRPARQQRPAPRVAPATATAACTC